MLKFFARLALVKVAILVLFFFNGFSFAWARGERMGEFRFSEFSLSPRGYVLEPSSGGFLLQESWLGAEWRKDESLYGEIKFGTGDLIKPTLFFKPQSRDLNLIEAYVQAATPICDLRAGLLQIPTSYETSVPEWEWFLPATRARQQVWFPVRDYGLALEFRNQGYTTTGYVYNGESGPNADNKLFYTGHWSYRNNSGWGWMLSATAGKLGPESTVGTQATLNALGFNLDSTKSSKVRFGNLSIYRRWERSLILIEGARGDFDQEDEKRPWAWGHIDISRNLGGDLNFLLRYEQSQSDLKRSETIVKSTGLGFNISSSDRLSAVTIFGAKNEEENRVSDDELWLIFRLNSNLL